MDYAVSGLLLNFIPHKAKALSEMARIVRPEGIVALYVWDYAGQRGAPTATLCYGILADSDRLTLEQAFIVLREPMDNELQYCKPKRAVLKIHFACLLLG